MHAPNLDQESNNFEGTEREKEIRKVVENRGMEQKETTKKGMPKGQPKENQNKLNIQLMFNDIIEQFIYFWCDDGIFESF